MTNKAAEVLAQLLDLQTDALATSIRAYGLDSFPVGANFDDPKVQAHPFFEERFDWDC